MVLRPLKAVLVTGSCLLVAAPLSTGVAQASTPKTPTPTVVVSGLNNPRQLSLVGNQILLIAEAGRGGTLATIESPEGGSQGIGRTGSISAVLAPRYATNQKPHRIVTGLLSAASPDGSGAVGPDGVSARSLNSIYIQQTAFPPDAIAALPAADRNTNGRLLRARPYGTPTRVADIAGYEQRHNPDRQGVESDPYAVLQVGDYQLVADAAGNDILKVKDGRISVFHTFPNITTEACMDPAIQQPPPVKPGCQFVPTSLATDRHGHIYVGALAGLVPGQGRVAELSRDGKHVLHTWTGLTSVTGVAVSRDGSVYASQLFAPEAAPVNPAIQGVLTRISRSGHRTNVDVPFPAGVAVDRQGNVFVSAFSIAPATGLADPATGMVVPGTSGQIWRLKF